MRTTLRIDDDLLRELKKQAFTVGIPLTELVNKVLRRGLLDSRARSTKVSPTFREESFSLGEPRVPIDKALALAAALEDEEIAQEMQKRK